MQLRICPNHISPRCWWQTWNHIVCTQHVSRTEQRAWRWSPQTGRGRRWILPGCTARIQPSRWTELLPARTCRGDRKRVSSEHASHLCVTSFPRWILTSGQQTGDQRSLLWSCERIWSMQSYSRGLQRDAGCYSTDLLWQLHDPYHFSSTAWMLPLRMKWKPEEKVRRALVVWEPPIFVHFIPSRARAAPKKPRHTAAIIRPRHTWM